MLKPFRRVVTGENEKGRSIFIYDGPAPLAHTDPNWPTRGVTGIWGSTVPASNEGNVLSEDVMPPTAVPLPNCVAFHIMQIAPQSELDKMSPEQRERATMPVGGTFPRSYKLDISQGPHMHATDSLDICIILSGEVTFYVDEGEVTLKQFDTIIDRGANHGWINNGTEPCFVACAVLDAEVLNRDAYKS